MFPFPERTPQPAYHSSFNELEGVREVGGLSILPLKTSSRGPALPANEGEPDIVDETLEYFRANMLFTQFDVEGGADRVLIYLTAFASQAIKKVAKLTSVEQAQKVLHSLGLSEFPLPGDPGWILGGHFHAPKNQNERNLMRDFLKQCREQVCARLLHRVFNEDGTPNKWWMAYSKRNFMGIKGA